MSVFYKLRFQITSSQIRHFDQSIRHPSLRHCTSTQFVTSTRQFDFPCRSDGNPFINKISNSVTSYQISIFHQLKEDRNLRVAKKLKKGNVHVTFKILFVKCFSFGKIFNLCEEKSILLCLTIW